MNEVFPPSVVDMEVEKTGVGVSLFEVCDPRVLSFSRFFEHRQANDPSFYSFSKVPFL